MQTSTKVMGMPIWFWRQSRMSPLRLVNISHKHLSAILSKDSEDFVKGVNSLFAASQHFRKAVHTGQKYYNGTNKQRQDIGAALKIAPKMLLEGLTDQPFVFLFLNPQALKDFFNKLHRWQLGVAQHLDAASLQQQSIIKYHASGCVFRKKRASDYGLKSPTAAKSERDKEVLSITVLPYYQAAKPAPYVVELDDE